MTTRTRSKALTDAQLTILARAAQHLDGVLSRPDPMAAGTFARTARQLLTKGLAERTGKPHPANGASDDAGASMALQITVAGLAAIGLQPESVLAGRIADAPSR